MTCIVGIVHDGGVIIGGDSAGSDRCTIDQRCQPKVFTRGEYAFGYTSSFRMGQLLQYRLEIDSPDTWDLDSWMATTFVDSVRQCLKDGGWARTSGGDDEPGGSEAGGTFLVGIRGQLYAIADDYQAGRVLDGYQAVGSGAEVALGALYATRHLGPQVRIRIALEAAEHVTPYVRGPFTTVTV